jgi:anti-sigma B factor antagonist
MSPDKSQLVIRQQGGVTVVGFLTPSMLDQSNVAAVGTELMELVEARNRKRMLIDFTGVKYLSSSLLGKLIALHKRLTVVEGELKLCAIDPSIYEIFQMMRLDRVFDIQPDEQRAISKFRGGMIG